MMTRPHDSYVGRSALLSTGGRLIVALVLAHCAPALLAADAPRDELEAHRNLWATAAIDDYEYGYNKYCECHRDHPPETFVTVRDGSVAGVRHQPFGFDHYVEAEPRNYEYYWTVEGLFDLVEVAIDRGVEMRVEYDETLGFPRHVYIDYDANLIGEELDVRLTRLEPLEN